MGWLLHFIDNGMASYCIDHHTRRYHLTAGEDKMGRNPGWRKDYVDTHACYGLTSRWIKLNGLNLTVPLGLHGDSGPGPMPTLAGRVVADGSAPMEIAGCSYGFAVLPNASAVACQQN